jgi:YggT family protein
MEILGVLARAIAWGLDGLTLVLIVSALLSWVRPNPRNPVVRFVNGVSEAVCNPIRRVVPTVFGGFDLAPLFAILALRVVGYIASRILLG